MITFLFTISGCTSRELYQTTQQWKQQECRKLPDTQQRQDCLASNAASYDEYRRSRDAARTAPQ